VDREWAQTWGKDSAAVTIGTALLQGLLSDAKERFAAISLSVSTTNPAMRLYERLGSVPIAQRDSSVIMLYRFD
jgi:ribosomal protein S18 acetylase RimI-like enzyme